MTRGGTFLRRTPPFWGHCFTCIAELGNLGDNACEGKFSRKCEYVLAEKGEINKGVNDENK